MIKSLKIFFIASLIFNPFQSLSAEDFPFSGREVGIGVAALIGGVLGGYTYASWNHPAALEKLKLEQEQTEKKKKEHAEQTERERRHAAEIQKVYALSLILDIQHTYADEFERLRREKLHERDNLLTIIKENCGMKDMPLNQYHAQLIQNLEALQKAEHVLPAEKKQEREACQCNLERILKVFNSQIADRAKQEKDAAENRRKNEEAEQRKLEKEQLEIRKLRLEVDTIKGTQQEFNHLHQKLDTLSNKLTATTNKETEHASELIGSVNALRVSVSQHAQEFKQTINRNHERVDRQFEGLYRLIDQARQYVNHLIGQQQPAGQPHPSFNSEYPQQPTPVPSAPPYETKLTTDKALKVGLDQQFMS